MDIQGNKKTITVYTCGVDYQHELGEAYPFTEVYPSIEALKEQRNCWENCGIVELEITLVKWVEPQDLWKGFEK